MNALLAKYLEGLDAATGAGFGAEHLAALKELERRINAFESGGLVSRMADVLAEHNARWDKWDEEDAPGITESMRAVLHEYNQAKGGE